MSLRAKGAFVLLLIGGIYTAAVFQWPQSTFAPFCFLRALTGLPCPSCGMTRSFHALARLDLKEAIGQNVASPILFSGIFIVAFLAAMQVITQKNILEGTWFHSKRIVFVAIVAMMGVAWLVNLYIFFWF